MNKCNSVFEKVPAHQEIQIESEHETEAQEPERQEMTEEDEEQERREAFRRERALLRESTAAFTSAR